MDTNEPVSPDLLKILSCGFLHRLGEIVVHKSGQKRYKIKILPTLELTKQPEIIVKKENKTYKMRFNLCVSPIGGLKYTVIHRHTWQTCKKSKSGKFGAF